MGKNLSNFCKLVKFEFVKLFRNKTIFFMSLFFSIALVVLLSSGIFSSEEYKIALLTESNNIESVEVLSIVDVDEDRYIMVENIDEGLELVKFQKVAFFVVVNNETDPETIKIYYNESLKISAYIKDFLNNKKNEYSYTAITDFLEECGIKLNKAYFEVAEFESVVENPVSEEQRLFPLEVSTGISIMIMFGLAYLVVKDNESGVNKILLYMPISIPVYLLAKMIPYLVVGIIELSLLFGIGALVLHIEYAFNIGTIILLSIIFIVSTICLGLVFSTFKSQIATAFADMFVILVPLVALTMSLIQSLIMPVRIAMYALPFTAYTSLLQGMIFNGVIDSMLVFYMIIQSIVYFFIAVLLFKKKMNTR